MIALLTDEWSSKALVLILFFFIKGLYVYISADSDQTKKLDLVHW